MRRFQIVTIILASMVLLSGTVVAQASPTAFLKKNNKSLDPLLKDTEKNKKRILKIVNKMLDFKILCKSSLGKHWQDRTDDQRKEFTDTLQALIEKNLIKRLKNSKDHVVTYESEEVDGKQASVVTMASQGDDPRAEKTEIAYKMHKQGNSWGVIDMVTDGISLVSNYRSQFNKIITEDGWPALMQKMKDKLAE